ncbi:MAG: sulfite exporter TauE/SafE family protein [Deltaproteobacteria bacterium]|nr:sulfite exporter TauE/SafE family protein [Deltaproteobacteria bacterium]
MGTWNLLIIFVVGAVAGFFGSLTGGGGLITVPALILAGLPPHIAVATNRLGSVGLFSTSWYKFHQKGSIDYRIALVVGIPFLIGSVFGARLLLQVDEALLKRFIALFTLLILAFMAFRSDVGIRKRQRSIRGWEYLLGGTLAGIIGIYAGFYAPGFGLFLAYVQILLFGQTFIESAATWKIGAVLFSVTTSVMFAFNDLILYPAAVVLFAGMSAGSYLGAHYSDRIGNVWVKRFFVAVVLITTLKMAI